jgi:ABC-type antimicrobial peptide transport system permease subunit
MALLGYAIGLPVGLAGIFFLIDTVARAVGFGPLTPPIDGLGLALLLPGVVLIAAIGAFIPAHRAGRISVVDMLRYE